MFRSNTGLFDKLLDKATSNLLMEPDWRTTIEVCDLIRQNDVQPKYALAGIKKKLYSTNPHTARYSLLVLESMVKNCGPALHEELTSKPFCEALHQLAEKTQHDNVREKLLELMQAWSNAFRKNPKHSALKETMQQMKAEGYVFPALAESDAMFSADTAPEWADGEACHRCRVTFSLVQRKHHCRACGQVFCSSCTTKSTSLPKYGIEKEVRVCDACYDQVNKPLTAPKHSDKQDSDLPAEYLKSSLAQQNQAPPQKSEAELREEEELQLALALSQSEAEAKEKEKMKVTSMFHGAIKTEQPRQVQQRSPSPQEEPMNLELARYLNRTYWENRQPDAPVESVRAASPSAPSNVPTPQGSESKYKENGVGNADLDDFVTGLKTQIEIFVNRMKSNSSRGRSIANDSSVQTLFLNITTMHSKLLRYIQQHDDTRLYYERLQDKLTQVKEARGALDALRDEHRDKLRRQAEEAERQRQLQMAQKLDIMRKKKQEYLQYQRQLALQRIQEQEREMQMRQEQQKQQYLMGPQYGAPPPPQFLGSPVHGQQFAPGAVQQQVAGYHSYGYAQAQMGMGGHLMGQGAPQMGQPPQGMITQATPHMQHPPGFPPGPPHQPLPQHVPAGMVQGLPPQHVLQQQQQQQQQQHHQQQQQQPGMPPPQGIPQQMGMVQQPMMGQFPQNQPPQFQQQPQPPQNQQQNTGEAPTAELISFD